MNHPVFIDSAGWIALLHSADSLHKQTVATYDKLVADSRDFVTTSLVLVDIWLLSLNDDFVPARFVRSSG
jgi:predicted nucleic acid-binding protein